MGPTVDIDNDGRLDLSVSRDRKYEGNYDDVEQKSWFGLLLQQDSGDFASLGHTSGVNGAEDDPLRRMKGAQNHAWSDVDGDGDLDLLVGGRDQGGGRPNFLFRNDIGHQNRWLQVDLAGDGDVVNSDAIGARVTLRRDETQRVREVRSSRGMYNSEDHPDRTARTGRLRQRRRAGCGVARRHRGRLQGRTGLRRRHAGEHRLPGCVDRPSIVSPLVLTAGGPPLYRGVRCPRCARPTSPPVQWTCRQAGWGTALLR